MKNLKINKILSGRDYLLYNMAALKLIKKLPDNSIDAIITDPPYNIGNLKSYNIKFNNKERFSNNFGEWDKDFNPKEYLYEFKRILKPNGNIAIFSSILLFSDYVQILNDLFKKVNFFVWHKTNPPPKVRKNSFLSSCEYIFIAWDEPHIFNFKKQVEMHNFFESSICMGKERLKGKCKHPTQKPLKLLKHLIEILTNKEQIILDPFMGVGSTGIAALELKRKFIGIDIDKKYFSCAKKRIKNFIKENNAN